MTSSSTVSPTNTPTTTTTTTTTNDSLIHRFCTKQKVGTAILIIILSFVFAIIVFIYSSASDLETDFSVTDKVVMNTFTMDDVGKARSRLNSVTDETLYQFLVEHHESQVLQYNSDNVIAEVVKAIERESVQVGVPLMMDLFSDVYLVWPSFGFTDKQLSQVRAKISDLKSFRIASGVLGITSFNYAANYSSLTLETALRGALNNQPPLPAAAAGTTITTTPKNPDELSRIITMGKKLMDDVRSMFSKFDIKKDHHGKTAFTLKIILQENSLNNLIALLVNAVNLDETAPYLKKIYDMRNEKFGIKPSSDERKKKDGSKDTNTAAAAADGKVDNNSSQKKRIPTEIELVDCSKTIEELELFVADKPQVSQMMRELLLETIR
jgi:hypothetical protein